MYMCICTHKIKSFCRGNTPKLQYVLTCTHTHTYRFTDSSMKSTYGLPEQMSVPAYTRTHKNTHTHTSMSNKIVSVQHHTHIHTHTPVLLLQQPRRRVRLSHTYVLCRCSPLHRYPKWCTPYTNTHIHTHALLGKSIQELLAVVLTVEAYIHAYTYIHTHGGTQLHRMTHCDHTCRYNLCRYYITYT